MYSLDWVTRRRRSVSLRVGARAGGGWEEEEGEEKVGEEAAARRALPVRPSIVATAVGSLGKAKRNSVIFRSLDQKDRRDFQQLTVATSLVE